MAIAAVNSQSSGAQKPNPFLSARGASDPFAKALGAASSPGAAKASEVEALRQSANLSLSEFRRTLVQLCLAAGIDTGVPFRLESDGRGGVAVAAYHPERDKIEQIFADNPDLAAKFQAIAQRFSALRAVEKGQPPADKLLEPSFGLVIRDTDVAVVFQ